MKLSTLFLGILMISILTGCDKLSKNPPVTGPAASSTLSQSDTLSTILLAELAGDRDQSDISTVNYLKLADSFHNPDFARRAMQIAMNDEDYPNALKAAEVWTQLSPQDPNARYSLSAVALEAKELDVALTAVHETLRLKPHWPEAIALEAQILLARHQPKEALDLLSNQLYQTPNNDALRTAYADMLLQLGATQAASAQYTKLFSSNRFSAYAHLSLGKIGMIQNNIPEAIKHLKIAALDPMQSNSAHYLLGAIAEDAKNYPEAVAFYSEIKEGPLAIHSQIHAALLTAQYINLTQAIDQLDSIPTFNADEYRQIAIAKSTILLITHHPQKAFDALNAALATLSMDKDLLLMQSTVSLYLGDYATAEKNLRVLLKEDPDNLEALNAMGTTLTEHNHDYSEANKYLTHGLSLAPNNSDLLNSMGWLQYRLHNYPTAIEYLKRSWQISPQVNTAAHLGTVLWAAGDHDAAYHIWQEGLRQFPNNPVIMEAIKGVRP